MHTSIVMPESLPLSAHMEGADTGQSRGEQAGIVHHGGQFQGQRAWMASMTGDRKGMLSLCVVRTPVQSADSWAWLWPRQQQPDDGGDAS